MNILHLNLLTFEQVINKFLTTPRVGFKLLSWAGWGYEPPTNSVYMHIQICPYCFICIHSVVVVGVGVGVGKTTPHICLAYD